MECGVYNLFCKPRFYVITVEKKPFRKENYYTNLEENTLLTIAILTNLFYLRNHPKV